MDSIKISDTVYDKQKFLNTVDIEFKELINKSNIVVEDTPSIEDFFILYYQLFYSIPKTGEYSHTTLISQSGDYLGINNSENIDIQTLLDEITQLQNDKYENELLISQLQSTSNP